MLSKMKMQLGVLWSTRMKMEFLDLAQDLEFLSLVVLLAANPITYSKGSYIPQAGAFKRIIYPTFTMQVG